MTKTTKSNLKNIDSKVVNEGEVRKFKMHPDLLFSVIKSQAGTREKAILEGVMNAVDAGATRCDISIDQDGYKISDDGKGFSSRKEVDEFFDTFGTPHKEGDSTYGKFRMGRGQLFAFSSTTWNTNTFEMFVDIKKTGLDYILKENIPFSNGCTILGIWYEKMTTHDVFMMIKQLEIFVKFMQIPVFINNKNISIEAEEQKWDYQEEDFYVKLNKNSSSLAVYNMGALVSNYSAHRFGVSGIVVTKKALKVNFARNDILVSECALWKKIQKKMKEIMGFETAKRNILTDAEIGAIIEGIVCDEILLHEIITKGLLLDVSGKKISMKTLLNATKISFSTREFENRKIQEKINSSKMALVLDVTNIDKFYVENAEEFVTTIQKKIDLNNREIDKLSKPYYRTNWTEFYAIEKDKVNTDFNPEIIDIYELMKSFKDNFDTLDDKNLKKRELIFVKSIREINDIISRVVYIRINQDEDYSWEDVRKFKRSILLGDSDVAQAWTDGKTYIVMNKNIVMTEPLDVVNILVHEYCHNSSTSESHVHGNEFYELFHEVLVRNAQQIYFAASKYQRKFNGLMLKAGIKPIKTFDTQIKLEEDFDSLKNCDFEKET